MANYASLISAIRSIVRENHNEEITGPLMQQSLVAMIGALGAYYQFVGVAEESTNPGTPDQNVMYIGGPGIYPNFNAVTVPEGYIGVFRYNGSWLNGLVQVGKNYDGQITRLETMVSSIQLGDMLTPGTPSQFPGYAGVASNLYVAANSNKFSRNTSYNMHWFLIQEDCVVDYVLGYYTASAAAAIIISNVMPAVDIDCVVVTNMIAKKSGSFVVRAGQYVCCTCYQDITDYLPRSIIIRVLRPINVFDEIGRVETKADGIAETRVAALAPTYFNGVRLVDTLTRQRFGRSTNNKIGNFVPVSATSNTITLSASDASCIANIVILSCKMRDGRYYNAYFSAANGNVITMLYDFNQGINCTNIEELQCLHDTINGAGGIHLSPYGYRAMAQMIYDDLMTKKAFSDVFVGGWSAQFCLGSAGYTDPTIRDANGVLVCSPELSGITVGGANNRCEMTYAANVPTNGPFYRTFYGITQTAPSGASATFRLNSRYPFKGFVRVNCSSEPGYDGKVIITVIDFDGNVIGEKTISQFADSYIFYLNEKYYNGVDVVVTMPDSVLTRVKITEMTLHETYIDVAQVRPINNTSVVALLGSSNTQFPHLPVAQELCPGDPDNNIVVRPDGTMGDGCGYFGKQLARISGAAVDNWGMSGEQTTYGLDIIQKIFAHKRYTHIVLSLFANDANAGRPWSEIITNIRQMVEYAKGQGCVPIIVMGYASNGTSVATTYALMYEDLAQGMDSPFIYTSSQMH